MLYDDGIRKEADIRAEHSARAIAPEAWTPEAADQSDVLKCQRFRTAGAYWCAEMREAEGAKEEAFLVGVTAAARGNRIRCVPAGSML